MTEERAAAPSLQGLMEGCIGSDERGGGAAGSDRATVMGGGSDVLDGDRPHHPSAAWSNLEHEGGGGLGGAAFPDVNGAHGGWCFAVPMLIVRRRSPTIWTVRIRTQDCWRLRGAVVPYPCGPNIRPTPEGHGGHVGLPSDHVRASATIVEPERT